MQTLATDDRTKSDLNRLLSPRSVAIVGASDKPGALGASVLANLERHGYAGAIHLINPKRDSIGGRVCLPSISALPDGVDAAVLAIPGAAILDAVRALAARNVGAAIIFSAGFAEGGEEGLAAQTEVARIAAESGMIVEGPNCLGMTNFRDGIPLTFVETPPHSAADANIGIVSQSGAMAVVLGTTLMAKGLPLSLSVSTGNEAASGVEDYVAHLINDPTTPVIGMIVEQFRSPRRFLALALAARAVGKTIILLHPGTSSAARESAATHTGAMAGDWALMRAKVEHAGVVVVDDLEQLGDVLDIALRCGGEVQGGTAVLTESGAFKALTLDLAERIGLTLPVPSAAASDALRATIPDFIPVSNPMDLTAQALVDPDLYRRTLSPLLADDLYGSVVLGIIQTDPKTSKLKFPPIIDAIGTLKPTKPVLFAGLDEGADVPAAYIAALRAAGVPYFPSADRAFRALAVLGRREPAGSEPESGSGKLPIALTELGTIPEYRAKALLAKLGIPFPASRFATTMEEARSAADGLGYPVVLKAQAAKLSHKSDAGGVILNLKDSDAVVSAWSRMYADVISHDPSLVLDGILVEAMGPRGVELIIGARNDPDWGTVVLAGFGGVQAEILKDVVLLVPGMTRDTIIRRLKSLKSFPLLTGWRGSPACDVDAIVDLIIAVGEILERAPQIREIDLNPVLAFPKGKGVLALDALIFAAA